MATTILLPAPVASSAIRIGQLLTDPLNPDVESFVNEHDSFPLRAPSIQTGFQETISRDGSGRFIERQSHASNATSILIQADQMTHTTLRDPLSAFRYTSRRASSQSYLHKAALRRQPLYFVTATQRITNPRFEAKNDTTLASEKAQVRRQDSGVSLNEQDSDVIYAVELRKVFCRVGSPEEPQRPNDAGYAYKHYKLQGEDELQLAVGFGQPVTVTEFRALVSLASDSDYTDESADSSDFEDEEDEGCMCCASSISNAAYRRY
ncbi:hypothetical protein BU23DRAFT_7472 [Bimuria novae-zelandiae CBS 107.79]|uniref:Uncharacterized protein n=1 Tax=Bimuria novae-zelandiae CBS 107.79 TaxID=1447943 RepID=A0A6A5VZT6_9PLEO|nr:hypothetical protein BU23DRAFT_7472 [Bimuria novae-zelandiae CBS 107.79]